MLRSGRDMAVLTRFNPYALGGLAARYDMSALNSYITATGVKLLGDKSGNSGVNLLALNGVAGNYASSLDSVALSITGDIFIWAKASFADWTGGLYPLVAKDDFNVNRSYQFADNAGALRLRWFPDGTTQLTANSSVNVPFGVYASGYVGATLQVNNGAGGYNVKFWTSTDGTTWTQLGATVVGGAPTAIFDGNAPLQIGSLNAGGGGTATGNIFQAVVGPGLVLTGPPAFNANFGLAAKLAASFIESSANVATVTINTTGDVGARICGARDLVQLTGSKQPTLSGGGALFDGVTQYLKTAAFALNQPETVYLIGQQVTWTLNDQWMDGNASGTLQMYQRTGTPTYGIFAGASAINTSNPLALGVNGIICARFNGALSLIRTNLKTADNGDLASATGASGFTLAANGGGATQFGNILAKEILIFSTAHDVSTQNRIIRFLANKWGVAA